MCGVYTSMNHYWLDGSPDFMKKPFFFLPISPGYGGGCDHMPKDPETPVGNGDTFIKDESHSMKMKWVPSFWQMEPVPTPSKSEAEGSEEVNFGVSIKYSLPGYGGGCDSMPKDPETPLGNGYMFIKDESHSKMKWVPSFWQMEPVGIRLDVHF